MGTAEESPVHRVCEANFRQANWRSLLSWSCQCCLLSRGFLTFGSTVTERDYGIGGSEARTGLYNCFGCDSEHNLSITPMRSSYSRVRSKIGSRQGSLLPLNYAYEHNCDCLFTLYSTEYLSVDCLYQPLAYFV